MAQGQFSFLDGLGGVAECFGDVVALEVRQGVEMPLSNPVTRPGDPMPPEGAGGGASDDGLNCSCFSPQL